MLTFTTDLLKEVAAVETMATYNHHVMDKKRNNLLLVTTYDKTKRPLDVLRHLPLRDLRLIERMTQEETNLVIHCILPTRDNALTNWFVYCDLDMKPMETMESDAIDKRLINFRATEKHITDAI